MKKIKLMTALFGALAVAACSNNSEDHSLYYWGDYSDVVYRYYNEPGDFAKQESDLNTIISQAKEKGKAVAPGVYGHLGLALLKQGKSAEAKVAFQQEEQLYPESRTFIQYLQRKK